MSTRARLALATAAALAASTLAAAPASAETEDTEILSTEFSSGELESWWDNGGAERISFPDVEGETVLAVDRSEDFHGIQSPHGILADAGAQPGDTVVYTAEIRLSEDIEVPVEARWIAHDDGAGHNYEWGASSEVDATGWTQVISSFEVTEDTDLEAFRAYTGLPSIDDSESYEYYIRSASLVLQSPVDPEDNGDEEDDEGEEENEDESSEDPIADSPESLGHDFEDGELGGWGPRYSDEAEPTVEVTDELAHTGDYSAAVTDRTHQGQGIGADATEALAGGVQYELSAALRFAEGEEPDDIWFSAATTVGGSTSYSTLGQLSGIDNEDFTVVTQQFTAPSADELFIYFETSWDGDQAGITSTFYIDDIEITRVEDDFDTDLTALKDTVSFPLGVAIDERETTGTAADVVAHHFDRVTPENHLKPESWFSGEGTETLRMHPQAEAILDYAAANDLGVYGHVLVWHSQTPAWFFRDAEGSLLSRDAMDARMEEHIAAVAGTIAEEYGLFGSETNPVLAYDVVNEVVADGGEHQDGMRRSEWYQIYGDESYVDQAFHYADQYFNNEYALEGTRPVALYINDYNTELSGKRERMIALTDRLLERGVPVDGFAHQFHLNLAMPISALRQAFQDVEAAFPGMRQAVTELDITVGDSVTEGALIDQAHHYRDAFRLFREWEDQLDSVAIWGLTDGRSWRSAQAPLVFNDNFTPKLAYYGIIDAELPPRENRAVVFQHDAEAAETAQYWQNLPLHTTEDEAAAFQIRWTEEGLMFYVESEAETVTVEYEGQSYDLDSEGVTELPISGLSQGDTVLVDLYADEDSWLGGTLNLVEPLSYQEIPDAEAAPELNATLEGLWESVGSLITEKEIETGERAGATAEVRAVHHDGTLHLLAEVTDPEVDVSHSDPWVQDSVEFFLDIGNERNGPYRTATREGHHLLSEQFDFQFRISAENEVSLGTGDEQFQLDQLESTTAITEEGYIVQAAIDLREYGGVGTVHGFDVQVNDSDQGSRLVTTWADPTGNGYQSTDRWGVLRIVGETEEPPPGGGPPGEEPSEQPTASPTGQPAADPTEGHPSTPSEGSSEAAESDALEDAESSEGLARTGATIGVVLLGALLLLGLGALVLRATHRRQGQKSVND